MPHEVHDHYFRRAKREGYRSRAAYKLIEIDDRKKILRPGDRVLDCGCAPGSWLQVAARRVGPSGHVVGLDVTAVRPPLNLPNVTCITGDLYRVEPSCLLEAGPDRPGGERRFDVILSDMAPATEGDRSADHHRSVRLCQRLLDLCPTLLRPGGHLVMKVCHAGLLFGRVKGYRPGASRSGSVEMYVVAHDHRVLKLEQPTTDDAPAGGRDASLPTGRPSPGWSRPAR
jgi:23S rRNA (uridine2552-2'-O)-methyltransferase